MPLELSRRTLLRGLGVAVALPWLEAMGANVVRGDAPGASPRRMLAMYVPNGVNMAEWTPAKEGADFELPSILRPLEKVKDRLLVLSGLTADGARPHGDGGGDHARAMAAFLTGAHPRKTDGTDIKNGISVDQVAAARIGDRTRLPSIEVGTEQGGMAGNCDSGYSCVYSSTMSWRSSTQPLPKEVNPKSVFERLFASVPDGERKERDARRKSVLDFVREDSKDLEGKLGSSDRRKLDEYFTAVRDIELRIDRAANLPPVKTPDMKTPTGVPGDFREHIRLMCDLVVLAFQADVTRVCTFVLANEGSNKAYPMIKVNEGHHELSHHGRDKAKLEKIRDINIFHATQLAYLLEKLRATPDGSSNLLENSMVAYGSGNSDGDAHNHDNLPILLAGGGGGTLKSGRHIRYAKETPLANLWLSLLERIDASVPSLGDSSGGLQGLA